MQSLCPGVVPEVWGGREREREESGREKRAGERREREREESGREKRAGERREREREESGREKRAGERREREREESGREKRAGERREREREESGREEPYTLVQHALIMAFLPIEHSLPDPGDLCLSISALHRNSVSPREGCFGFPVPSYHGSFSQLVAWDSDWSRFFAKLLAHLFEYETQLHGPWDESHHADFRRLIDHTVPRLLRPLQANGRTLKPCLVHGNLSSDTMGVNLETGRPVIFSPSPLYAHNEYELGSWWRKKDGLSWAYLREYQKNYPPSEPFDEWDDRILLYSIKFKLLDVVSTRNVLAFHQ